MKKIITCLLFVACLNVNCSKSDESQGPSSGGSSCGTYKNGQQLYKGSEGGCYYINSGGNKTYVERSACTCN